MCLALLNKKAANLMSKFISSCADRSELAGLLNFVKKKKKTFKVLLEVILQASPASF